MNVQSRGGGGASDEETEGVDDQRSPSFRSFETLESPEVIPRSSFTRASWTSSFRQGSMNWANVPKLWFRCFGCSHQWVRKGRYCTVHQSICESPVLRWDNPMWMKRKWPSKKKISWDPQEKNFVRMVCASTSTKRFHVPKNFFFHTKKVANFPSPK